MKTPIATVSHGIAYDPVSGKIVERCEVSRLIRFHALSQFPQRLVEAVRRFAAHPRAMSKVLGIVYRAISTHLIHKAGLQIKDGATGAVTPARPGWYSALDGSADQSACRPLLLLVSAT